MKLITLSILFCFSSILYAGVSLDIDFKKNEKGESIIFKKKIEAYYGEIQELKIPKTNKILEVLVTDKIPDFFTEGQETSKNQVLIKIKLIELRANNERVTIMSPQMVTLLGSEATMETYETKPKRTPLMTLKVRPTKI